MSVDVTPIRGAFRICKDGRRRDVTYDRFSGAEAAALRLLAANPGETFVITQEVARVGERPTSRSGVPITRRAS